MKRIVSLSGEEIKKLSKYGSDFHVALNVVLALLERSEKSQKIESKDPIPEGYELVGEVDIPETVINEAQKDSTKLVPINILTGEDLKKRNQIAKEIIGMKGRTLLIAKQNGESWPYTVKDEIPNETLKLLEERREEGSSILGLALFQVSPNSPLLKLISVSL